MPTSNFNTRYRWVPSVSCTFQCVPAAATQWHCNLQVTPFLPVLCQTPAASGQCPSPSPQNFRWPTEGKRDHIRTTESILSRSWAVKRLGSEWQGRIRAVLFWGRSSHCDSSQESLQTLRSADSHQCSAASPWQSSTSLPEKIQTLRQWCCTTGYLQWKHLYCLYSVLEGHCTAQFPALMLRKAINTCFYCKNSKIRWWYNNSLTSRYMYRGCNSHPTRRVYSVHSHAAYTASLVLTDLVGGLVWLHAVEECAVMRRVSAGVFLFLWLSFYDLTTVWKWLRLVCVLTSTKIWATSLLEERICAITKEPPDTSLYSY